MSRIWGRIASILGVAVVASASLPGCTSDEAESIFIRAALAPPANRQNNQCVYTNDSSQPVLFQGVLDLGVRDTYVATLLVGNQLSARSDQNNNRAESNRVRLTGVEVRVADLAGNDIGSFSAPSTGLADPQTNNTPSYGLLRATLLDAKTSALLAGSVSDYRLAVSNLPKRRTVLAFIKAVGTTLAGTEVKSGEYQLPIDICNGCLVNFVDGIDPAKPLPNCAKPFVAGTGSVVPCTLGQDETVPCQLCQGLPACSPTL